SRMRRRHVRVRALPVRQESGREALPLGDALGFDRDGVYRLLDAIQPFLDRVRFRRRREPPGAVSEPHAREQQNASTDDREYGNDERCIRIHDQLRFGVSLPYSYVPHSLQVSCPYDRATRAATLSPTKAKWNTP